MSIHLHAKALAMSKALEQCQRKYLRHEELHIDCQNLLTIIDKPDWRIVWRMRDTVNRIRSMLDRFPGIQMKQMSINSNGLPDIIAKYARKKSRIISFHKGMNLPRWIIETAISMGLKI